MHLKDNPATFIAAAMAIEVAALLALCAFAPLSVVFPCLMIFASMALRVYAGKLLLALSIKTPATARGMHSAPMPTRDEVVALAKAADMEDIFGDGSHWQSDGSSSVGIGALTRLVALARGAGGK